MGRGLSTSTWKEFKNNPPQALKILICTLNAVWVAGGSQILHLERLQKIPAAGAEVLACSVNVVWVAGGSRALHLHLEGTQKQPAAGAEHFDLYTERGLGRRFSAWNECKRNPPQAPKFWLLQ